ncbi:uncharacterized protein EI97DRAFT_302284 [Westerdykella ornata]|uniref:Uncharacterized protein n=1 Tax=Westerdykella ornata TaxID=318751 RepID=A0A6A6J3Y5_WESOR|nr:uncharacterized protein EI97DRAFT_302284 [Westerdykella ornata]KAF2271281.1 hypothetical protein EI97DRAFT_302284 [Westerdykella ornata]
MLPTLRLPNHESRLPSISANHTHTLISSCSTPLSFCFSSNLAIVKRLTWEQTPWVLPHLDSWSRRHIEECLSLHLRRNIPEKILDNALLLGECYEPTTRDAEPGHHPQMFVVFPNLKRDVLLNEQFLTFWHDEVMRPSFRQASEDSGLVEVDGDEAAEFAGRMKMPGAYGGREPGTGKRVFPAAGILNHLRAGSTRRVFARWPEWHDRCASGYEGKYSDVRAKLLGEAWSSITGMLSGKDELEAPLLLLVWRGRTSVSGFLTNRFTRPSGSGGTDMSTRGLRSLEASMSS